MAYELKLKHRGSLLLGFLVAALCALAIFGVAGSAGAEGKYSTNGSGLTYGSLGEVYSAEKNPDLIGAIATNGELGFIYYDDYLEAISGDVTLSPEQAVSRANDKTARMAEEFSEAAADLYGIDVLDQAMVEKSISFLDEGAEVGEAAEILNSDIEQAVSKTSRANDAQSTIDGVVPSISEDEYLELYLAAKESVGVKLPVYAEDGATVVGEFVVDVL